MKRGISQNRLTRYGSGHTCIYGRMSLVFAMVKTYTEGLERVSPMLSLSLAFN